MSHTTEIGSIVFSDIAALRAAVADLKAQGINCDLIDKAVPRAYFPNQEGMGAAPHVLKLHDCPYDVGFYPATSGKGYVARTDLFAGHVSRVLGVVARPGESLEQAALGKLNQSYAVHAAIREAARRGYTVRKVTKEDGTIQLHMTGMAG